MDDCASWRRDLLILSLLLCALFGYGLGERALWSPDEGRYSEIPREMVATGDYVTPRLNGVKYFEKPPFFYWLQGLSIELFGVNEWALRLWAATFAYIGCLAVYITGRRLFGRRAGWLSTVVLATSMLYYAMGRIITLDMAVSVLLTCALLAFLLAVREPPGGGRRAGMWAFFAFAALATLTKGLIGILIPAMVIGSWILLLGEWRVLKTMYLVSGIALFLAIAAPWHILVSRANPEFLDFYIVHEHFQRYLTKHHGPRQVWIFIPVLLVGLFPWTVYLAQAIRRSLLFSWAERRRHREALFLMLWAGLVFLFFSFSSSKLIPYILPVFPPLAILIGRYFSLIWDKRDDRGIRSGYWAFLLASWLMVGAGLVVAPRRVEGYFDPARLDVYMYEVAAVLVLGSLATFVAGRRAGFAKGFISMTATAVLMLLVVNNGLPLFDDNRSVKSLAAALAPRLGPGDVVATYHTYYQDLPVYLGRRVDVVGWKGELSFGSQAEDVTAWIIDDATLWKKWDSSATIYMLMEEDTYQKLRLQSARRFYPIVQSGFHVLVSNKAEPPAHRAGVARRDAALFDLAAGRWSGKQNGEERT